VEDLAALAPGTHAVLVEVGGERSFRRRLMELGLLPGTSVRIVRRVDVGDLVEIEVRGCHLSLRRSEAARLRATPRAEHEPAPAPARTGLTA
jgi:ferrous iron transport protein A